MKVNALVGIAKCQQFKKVYGVRIEVADDKWTATWAFPITPEVVKREKYQENQFPSDLKYGEEYPGCPYCHQKENLFQLSNKPKSKTIAVTSSGCDDIGSILRSMKIKYSAFSTIRYKCDILFVNCLTNDTLSAKKLREFVESGGCLYASCYADDIVKEAFPNIIVSDHSGRPHTETVSVEDAELKQIIGSQIEIEFDTAWAKLYEAKDCNCILRSTQNKKLPIMVSLRYGKGIIFFTCFHNHVQASEKEKALLQLLVLRQIGFSENMTIEEAGLYLNVDLNAIKSKFLSNF